VALAVADTRLDCFTARSSIARTELKQDVAKTKADSMNLVFEYPIFLILTIIGLVLGLWFSKLQILRQPIPLLRTLSLLTLGLAIANPLLEQRRAGLVILEDVSDSAARSNLPTIAAKARLSFAGRAGSASRENLEPNQTDIATALQTATALQPSRILLISDGNQTRGDAVTALPNIPVDVLAVGSRDNAAVVDLIAPDSLAPGATVQTNAILETSQKTSVRVKAMLNGVQLTAKTIILPIGRSSLPLEFQVSDRGGISLEVSIIPDFAQPTSDDSRSLALSVKAPREVLVINDPAMAKLLRTQGFKTKQGNVALVREPLAYSAVFIRAAATLTEDQGAALTRSQQELLRRYIEDGGGVMLTGGDQSFGLGGWNRSLLEASLPVSSDLRTRVDVPLVSMVMVVDRSLSMVGTGGSSNSQKLGLALEGVANVVELANERDFLGLIVFSDTPNWIFKPTRANENNKIQMLRAIESIEAVGGTIVAPAYLEAIAALENSKAAVKHIIILTDGQFADSEGSNPPNFAAIARAAKQRGITTSSIGVGGDADSKNLKIISGAGGGRYYQAQDPDTLPRIFTTEALTSKRALIRTNQAVTLQTHPLANSVSSNPPRATKYIATTLKSEAEPILMGADREPILAVIRKGLGRSAALTIDLNRSDTLTNWKDLPGLLGTVARWLEIPETPYSLSISPDASTVSVDAVERNQYRNNLALEVRVGSATITLKQTAPGRYEASLPKNTEGSLALISRGVLLERRSLNTQNRELETTGGEAKLRQIAKISGGQYLENLEGYVPAQQISSVPLAAWLALLGLLIFITELAWRRFRT
jgi:Ca-activated chloride channel homolog